jgi:hypothetical protein
MGQQKLFYEDEYEALTLMISHSTKSRSELAHFLFPDKKHDTAYARLTACITNGKDERLSFGQIIAAMKFCECYEPLLYACDETLHARPDRKAATDQEIVLIEVLNSAGQTMQAAMRKLEQLQRLRGIAA